ncbi:hypothetical protein GCM10011492_09780 [Flexivirga endophytica]|uniref:Uncharacterized protein n=1 Tax=Flexivirga endophytica TaxID=1849103 RepID=A0A916SY88_9MICO|nr:hypothetical protein [Flexivirga endophytica]GGB21930.1 hypothetical protein GCM10011492_09780 [Flexivirga endophytica]GHB59534.1 hypothetical protein GCM10008112_30800 [Flexivirga endophytica]
MQRSRRTDPYPWTWERPVGVMVAYFLGILYGFHTGRALANCVAGAGWSFTPDANLFTAIPGVVHGNAAAGISGLHHPASSLLLWSCIVLVELLVVVALSVALKMAFDRWGPNRVQGMASRDEAEDLLGRTRLRKVSGVVRPDLYGKKGRVRG